MTATMAREKRRFRLVSPSPHYVKPDDFKPGDTHAENEARRGDHLHTDILRRMQMNDVIETCIDMEAKFPNKFKDVTKEDNYQPINMDIRRPIVDGLIATGTWDENDRKFLESLPEDNFQRIIGKVNEMARKVIAPEGKSTSILGEDVTASYGLAYDHGYKVFRNPKGKHNVTLLSNVEKPVNPTPLDADKVLGFVERHIATK
jgi:hypothetical protein